MLRDYHGVMLQFLVISVRYIRSQSRLSSSNSVNTSVPSLPEHCISAAMLAIDDVYDSIIEVWCDARQFQVMSLRQLHRFELVSIRTQFTFFDVMSAFL
jgi:hypothetical protein